MAVFLLAVLAFFSAAGTFVAQGEKSAFYREHYGAFWGNLFLALGIDNLYYAPWFILLLALVAVNLIISNVRRWDCLVRTERGVKVAVGSLFFTKSQKAHRLDASSNIDGAAAAVDKGLRSLGYRIRKEAKDRESYWYAEKGGLRKWGSLMTHTGILVVFIGVIYGHLPGMGFKGMANLSLPGLETLFPSTYEIRQAGFSIRLLDTGSRSDEKGRPTDFFSTVEVIDGGRKVKEKTIRVNDPLEYKDVKLYQSNFGVVGFTLQVKGPDGKDYTVEVPLSPDGIPQLEDPQQVGKTRIFLFLHKFFPHMAEENGEVVNKSMNYDNPAARVVIYENFSRDRFNEAKAKAWVSRDKPLKYQGYTVMLGKIASYTGLSYRKDPGVPCVWTGFLITTLGLMMSFYISERTVRALLLPGEKNSLFVITNSRLDEGFERELTTLRDAVREA
jgi:cytochrome c biogenesis protein